MGLVNCLFLLSFSLLPLALRAFECPGEGKWPEPTNPQKYHVCSLSEGQFTRYTFTCPPETIFCSQFSTCQYPEVCPSSNDQFNVSLADPFQKESSWRQMTCTEAGLECNATCKYVDWYTIPDRKIISPPRVWFFFQPHESTRCFQQCLKSSRFCTAYSFNTEGGQCNLYDIVKLEYIQNTPGWSLGIRKYPSVSILNNEWHVTTNLRPRGASLKTEQVTNWVQCMGLCSYWTGGDCAAAVFELLTSNCTLYPSSSTKDVTAERRLVTIQHTSSMYNHESWRFIYFGAISPGDVEPFRSLTTQNVNSCLSECAQTSQCMMVTVRGSEDGVTCQIWNYTQTQTTLIEEDDGVHSYLLNVPKMNTQYKQLPHYVQPRPKLSSMLFQSSPQLCHLAAKNNPKCAYYSFNETNAVCRIFHKNNMTMRIYSNYPPTPGQTFSKTLVSNNSLYYSFNSYWVSNSPPLQYQQVKEYNLTLCMEQCLDSSVCVGVALNSPEGSCVTLNEAELNGTNQQIKEYPADLAYQIFVKLVDLRFLENQVEVNCHPKTEIDDHLKLEQNLQTTRDSLCSQNSTYIPPHGSGFTGGATFSLEPGQKSRSKLNTQVSTRSSRKKKNPVDVGMSVVSGVAAGAAIGAALGGGAGAVVGAIGMGAASAIGSGLLWLGCSIFGCGKEEHVSCDIRCGNSKVRSGVDALCFCKKQPETTPDENSLHLIDQGRPELQENCENTHVGQKCPICCRVGYEPESNPECVCSDNSEAFWDPNPTKCRGKEKCHLELSFWGQDDIIELIPIESCHGQLYYGVAFNIVKKIPFYSIYYFSSQNKETASNKDFTWRKYPCTELEEFQISGDDYTAINSNLPDSWWDRGHLTPKADMRFTADSIASTFFFVNAAPQDRHTNQQIWRILELRIRNLLSTRPGHDLRGGYVMTGVCLGEGYEGQSIIPKCFWKLVCTRTNNDEVTVAAFYHPNTPTTRTNAAQMKGHVFKVRDQSELTPDLVGFDSTNLWYEALKFDGLGGNGINPEECARASKINFPKFPGGRSGTFGDEHALYNFWNDNLFGEDFDPNIFDGEENPEVPQSSSGSPPLCKKKVVGYVTGWSDVPFTVSAASYLTHVIFAFVEIKSDGRLVVGSADTQNSANLDVDAKKSFLRLHEIKLAKQKLGGRLKTMFAVGGWENSQYYSKVAGNSQLTENFIRTAIDLIDYFDMDGVDIDWEYPVGGGANVGVKEDRENYVKFLSSLRTALTSHAKAKGRSSYLITIAGAAGSWVLEPGYDLEKITKIIDWVNVMTYDYNGAWDSKWGAYTGPHAPLYFGAPHGYSGKTNVDFTLKYYTCRIGDPSKVVMGLGFYGRYWNHSGSAIDSNDPVWRQAIPNESGKFDGGFEPWSSVKKSYLSKEAFTKSWHEKTKTPYMTNKDGFLLAYEDPRSIQEKVKYAAAKGLGGVMIWAIDLDDPELTMLRTASSSVLCGGIGSNGISGNYKCPPIQEQRWWTLLDGDGSKGGMCGKSAPLFNGYYPVCDPEDPGFSCCSTGGWCGSGDSFCKCDGCVNYYDNPEKILDEPVKPKGPVRWHTLDTIKPGAQCGYTGQLLPSGKFAICNPDDPNGHCCSPAGYCGKSSEFCECEGCVNFKTNPNFEFPPKTWIDQGADAGKCGKNAKVNGKPATCNPLSTKYHCCSASGYCGTGAEYCTCAGCVDFKI